MYGKLRIGSWNVGSMTSQKISGMDIMDTLEWWLEEEYSESWDSQYLGWVGTRVSAYHLKNVVVNRNERLILIRFIDSEHFWAATDMLYTGMTSGRNGVVVILDKSMKTKGLLHLKNVDWSGLRFVRHLRKLAPKTALLWLLVFAYSFNTVKCRYLVDGLLFFYRT